MLFRSSLGVRGIMLISFDDEIFRRGGVRKCEIARFVRNRGQRPVSRDVSRTCRWPAGGAAGLEALHAGSRQMQTALSVGTIKVWSQPHIVPSFAHEAPCSQ